MKRMNIIQMSILELPTSDWRSLIGKVDCSKFLVSLNICRNCGEVTFHESWLNDFLYNSIKHNKYAKIGLHFKIDAKKGYLKCCKTCIDGFHFPDPNSMQ